MIALLGPSGCGKTTILKLIAGLLAPDHGTISMDGKTVNDAPAEKRNTAMVFQKPLLFPHMSVGENVGFSLRLRGVAAGEILDRVREALAMVRLEGFEARRPNQLSGGQEQRVSLARALVSNPRILLLDEPFAALDENLRTEVRSLVRAIQRKLQITAVFVTHDRDEAAAMAHRIALMHAGRIEQSGTLREFYQDPATVEAAKFFGWQVLRGEIDSGYLATALGRTAVSVECDGSVWAAVRSEAVDLVTNGAAGAAGTVESSVDMGTQVSTILRLSTGESMEICHQPPELTIGEVARVSVRAQAIRLFPRT
jgi:ABC-type Fe3+/spermidine/putrescine transport system ATPase subunit